MSSLYDVNCNVYFPCEISRKEKVISSQSIRNDVVVAFNNKLTLIEDNGVHASTFLSVDCKVTSLNWSTDGELLAVSDASGLLYIVSRKEFKVLFSHRVSNIKENTIRSEEHDIQTICFITFISSRTSKGLYSIAAASTEGKVYLLENFAIPSNERGDTSLVSKKNMSRKNFFNTSSYHKEKLCWLLASCYVDEAKYLTAGYGEDVIVLWEDQTVNCWSDRETVYTSTLTVKRSFIRALTNSFHGFKKIVHTSSTLFALCDQGHLYLFDVSHLILLKWWPVNFLDFTVKMPISLLRPEGVKESKVYSFTRNVENGSIALSVHELRDMSKVFDVSCDDNAVFVSSSGHADDVFFIDRAKNSSEDENVELMLKNVSKASPDSRLLLLLQQHKYEEAEEFATKFNLDTQPVYQQKASYLLHKLSMMSDSKLIQSAFDKFKNCASKIADSTFVAELCITVSPSDFNTTFQLLTLAREHLDSGGRKFRALSCSESTEDMDLCLEIDRLMDLQVTFRMAFKDNDNVTWESFRSAKLSTLVATLLVRGSLQAATVVCARHEIELICFLEEDEGSRFKNLLKVVAQDADTDDLVTWLEQIIPVILSSSIPQAVEILTSWLYNRTLALEEICSEKWPENALKVASVFFSAQKKLSRVGFIREQLSSTYLIIKSKKEEVARLRLLVSRLQLLIRLRSRYQCNISLESFVKETTVTLTFRMLDEVTAPELVPKRLETTVRPYMKEHQLDEDGTLLLYIKEELEKCQKHSWGVFQSLRERKIAAIVKCLRDKKVVVEATAELAKKGSIPWSRNINELVKTAINVADAEIEDGSIVSADDKCKESFKRWKNELLHCVHLERVPVITAKYDLGEVLIRDNASLKHLVRILIKQDSKEALDDALMMARTFSDQPQETVYLYRVNYLINKGMVSECVAILEEVPDIAVPLVKHTLVSTMIVLRHTHRMWAADRANHCLVSINMVDHMLRNVEDLSASLQREWKNDLSMLKSIYALQNRYNEIVSIDEYNNKERREAMLARTVMLHYKSKEASALSSTALPQSNVADLSDTTNVGNALLMDQSKRGTGMNGAGNAKPSLQGRESYAGVLHMARLLKVPQETMQSHIAIQAAKKCQVKATLDICKDLSYASPSEDTAKVLQMIALILLRYMKSYPDRIHPFISDILEIVQFSATCCLDDQLLDVVSLFNLCELTRDVHSATDVCSKDLLSKYLTSSSKISQSDHVNWANTWYEETDALSLRASDVFPIVAQLTDHLFDDRGASLSRTGVQESYTKILSELGDLVVQMASRLKNTRHCVMALQWSLKMQCVIVSYLSNHKAFFTGDLKIQPVIDVIVNIVKQANNEIKGYMEVLSEKVLLSRKADVPFAVGLLLGLPADVAFKLLNNISESASNNFKKITAVAQAGLNISRFLEVLTQVPHYEQLLLDAKWAHDLNAVKVPVDGLLFSPQQWKKKYLLKLICYPTVSGSLILDYCRDYQLDCDSALLQYVAILLGAEVPSISGAGVSSPETCVVEYTQMMSSALLPVNHSPSTVLGRKQKGCSIEEEKRSWKKVTEELNWIALHINDKYELQRQLELCLRTYMCPYDYDRAEFMLQLIRSCSSATDGILNVDKAMKLIGYLRHVTRERAPSEYELRRLWRGEAVDLLSVKDLPSLARTRLPLHPLIYGDASHAWKVIANEVTERSAEYLAPVAKLLRLSEDKLYMTAADNIISRYMTGENKQVQLTSWQLERIQGLTEKIVSPNMAVAMAKRIAEVLPCGEEKVTSYEWCMSLIKKWRDTLPRDCPEQEVAANAFATFEWNYKQAYTEMCLKKSELEDMDYRKLMTQPKNLIIHLYQHPSVVQRFYEPGNKYPDIHSLVDKVTEVHQLDGAKIRLGLVLNLLLAANKQNEKTAEDDSTINLERLRTVALVEDSTDDTDERELIQLLYLLSYDNPIKQAKYLLKLVSDHKNRRITNACRVRALHCLFHIIDDDEKIFQLTEKTADDLRSDLRVLIYLTELEAADFKIPVSHLRQHDKSSVASTIIASSRRHNPLALRASAEMCREYGSVPSDIWAVMLQQLVALQQVTYLQQLLPDICRIPSVRSLPCLASVWQSCVTLPLVALTSPLSDKQREFALSAYRFLLRCPVLLRIDLTSVAQHFCALELPVLAIACLLLSPNESNNARSLAKSRQHKIVEQLHLLNSKDQPLLGYNLISTFLQDIA